MVGLIGLQVYNRNFDITEKIDLLTDTFDEFSFEVLKDELDEILSIWDVTPCHLQHETKGPRNIQTYKKLRSEKWRTDGHIIIIKGYARS